MTRGGFFDDRCNAVVVRAGRDRGLHGSPGDRGFLGALVRPLQAAGAPAGEARARVRRALQARQREFRHQPGAGRLVQPEVDSLRRGLRRRQRGGPVHGRAARGCAERLPRPAVPNPRRDRAPLGARGPGARPAVARRGVAAQRHRARPVARRGAPGPRRDPPRPPRRRARAHALQHAGPGRTPAIDLPARARAPAGFRDRQGPAAHRPPRAAHPPRPQRPPGAPGGRQPPRRAPRLRPGDAPAPRDRQARPHVPQRHRAREDPVGVRDGVRGARARHRIPQPVVHAPLLTPGQTGVRAGSDPVPVWSYDGRMVTVPTGRLQHSADGTPFSPRFQDVYHASHGGIAQARHVFLAGNELPARWASRERFVILETGFGLGVNFLAAWDAWRRDPRRPARLHFISVESEPFTRADLSAALAPFAEFEELARALASVWPPPLAGFHRLHFDAGNVILTLLRGDARKMLPQLVAEVDAFFLDGFSPAKNPGIWSPEVVREVARFAAPGATLATWTVAGGVRAALADAGFTVDKREGFGAKREMLVGELKSRAPGHGNPHERRAVIVGAGLAGTVSAERLAARGWEVALVDARADRSVSAVGLVRPIANLRDALNARVSRSAFLYALQHYRALQHDGYHLVWNRSGVLQLAENDAESSRFAAIARSHGYPASFLEFVDAARASELAGRKVRGAGWWFPDGAWVSPESLAVASLARAGDKVNRHIGRPVARIERERSEWRALDADDRVIAEAPGLVVANAVDARRLLPEARLTLSSVR